MATNNYSFINENYTNIESKPVFLNQLNLRDTFNQMTVSWENINVYAPIKAGFLKKSISRVHILHDVCGIAKPGELLAIMGASGSGKTTLLNVLNCRNRGDLDISGDTRMNGQSVASSLTLATVSGYVQQEDLYIGTLTVKEHLKFQAMLRMDQKCTYEERLARIHEVMNDLNLKKCEDTLIGNELRNVKGISGGEKRRLAFATEILTNPGILFCDEPTSGLDSFMAQTVVESMRSLAKKGKTIICTIHQPSSELFQMLDKLCLLAEGRLAYFGDLPQANDFFANEGYLCPKNYNPADYYISKIAISPVDKERSTEEVLKICNGFSNSYYSTNLKEDLNQVRSQALKQDVNNFINTNSSRFKASVFSQTKWLLWRNFLTTVRDPLATKIQIIQVIMLAVIFGLIYLRQKLDQTSVQNINGVIFLCITNTTFSNLFAVLNSFPAELPIFLRDHYNGMYRVGSYYISKILTDQFGFIFLPFVFATIVYWMANLTDDLEKYLIFVGVIVLVANISVSFGGMISSIASSPNVAIGIAGPLLTPLMIFGGSFLNNKTIERYFYWIKYVSWLGYANEVLLVNQWDDIEFISCNNITDSICRYNNGTDVLNVTGMNEDHFYLDLYLMGALYITFRIFTYGFLCLKSNRHK